MEPPGGSPGLGRLAMDAGSFFNWVSAGIVVISMDYLSLVLTLRDWLSALRRGEAVTFVSQRGGRQEAVLPQATGRLNQELALRPEDLFVSLVDVKKEDWSFGNGEAQ